MPKELFVINDFSAGIICNGDIQDIPENACIMCVNVNPNGNGILSKMFGPTDRLPLSRTSIKVPTDIQKIVINENNNNAVLGYLLIDDIRGTYQVVDDSHNNRGGVL